MTSELFGVTFAEEMENKTLGELTTAEIATYAAKYKGSLTPPGHLEEEKVKKYLTRIYALFEGQAEIDVQIVLGGFAIVHDVGATQDFSVKPDIKVGTVSVNPSRIFGDIIPITVEGEARKFCATLFEKNIKVLLSIYPEAATMLAARSAKAGQPAANPEAVISFVKGVTPSTMGLNSERQRAKAVLLRGNRAGALGAGAAVTADSTAARVTEQFPSSGHEQIWG